MFLRPILSPLLLITATASLCAQILPFHTLTTADGLAGNRITSLCQDSRGYLWIGTFDGLSEYDGLTFKNYTVTDGLATSLVWCLTESRRLPGTMWVGTEAGLSKMQDGVFSTVSLGPGADANKIYSLCEDRIGALWCTTRDGIRRLAHDSVSVVIPDAPVDATSTLVESPDGRIWVAIGHTLYAFSPVSGSSETFPLALPARVTIPVLNTDREGDLWLIRSDSVVAQFRGTGVVNNAFVPAVPDLCCSTARGCCGWGPGLPSPGLRRRSSARNPGSTSRLIRGYRTISLAPSSLTTRTTSGLGPGITV